MLAINSVSYTCTEKNLHDIGYETGWAVEEQIIILADSHIYSFTRTHTYRYPLFRKVQTLTSTRISAEIGIFLLAPLRVIKFWCDAVSIFGWPMILVSREVWSLYSTCTIIPSSSHRLLIYLIFTWNWSEFHSSCFRSKFLFITDTFLCVWCFYEMQ